MFRGKEGGNQNQFSIEKKMREESPSSFWVIDFELQPPPPLQYSEWKGLDVKRKGEILYGTVMRTSGCVGRRQRRAGNQGSLLVRVWSWWWRCCSSAPRPRTQQVGRRRKRRSLPFSKVLKHHSTDGKTDPRQRQNQICEIKKKDKKKKKMCVKEINRLKTDQIVGWESSTVDLIGWIENGPAEAFDCRSSDHVQNNVLQTAADIMIDGHNHSVASNNGAADYITLKKKLKLKE